METGKCTLRLTISDIHLNSEESSPLDLDALSSKSGWDVQLHDTRNFDESGSTTVQYFSLEMWCFMLSFPCNTSMSCHQFHTFLSLCMLFGADDVISTSVVRTIPSPSPPPRLGRILSSLLLLPRISALPLIVYLAWFPLVDIVFSAAISWPDRSIDPEPDLFLLMPRDKERNFVPLSYRS